MWNSSSAVAGTRLPNQTFRIYFQKSARICQMSFMAYDTPPKPWLGESGSLAFSWSLQDPVIKLATTLEPQCSWNLKPEFGLGKASFQLWPFQTSSTPIAVCPHHHPSCDSDLMKKMSFINFTHSWESSFPSELVSHFHTFFIKFFFFRGVNLSRDRREAIDAFMLAPRVTKTDR